MFLDYETVISNRDLAQQVTARVQPQFAHLVASNEKLLGQVGLRVQRLQDQAGRDALQLVASLADVADTIAGIGETLATLVPEVRGLRVGVERVEQRLADLRIAVDRVAHLQTRRGQAEDELDHALKLFEHGLDRECFEVIDAGLAKDRTNARLHLLRAESELRWRHDEARTGQSAEATLRYASLCALTAAGGGRARRHAVLAAWLRQDLPGVLRLAEPELRSPAAVDPSLWGSPDPHRTEVLALAALSALRLTDRGTPPPQAQDLVVAALLADPMAEARLVTADLGPAAAAALAAALQTAAAAIQVALERELSKVPRLDPQAVTPELLELTGSIQAEARAAQGGSVLASGAGLVAARAQLTRLPALLAEADRRRGARRKAEAEGRDALALAPARREPAPLVDALRGRLEHLDQPGRVLDASLVAEAEELAADFRALAAERKRQAWVDELTGDVEGLVEEHERLTADHRAAGVAIWPALVVGFLIVVLGPPIGLYISEGAFALPQDASELGGLACLSCVAVLPALIVGGWLFLALDRGAEQRIKASAAWNRASHASLAGARSALQGAPGPSTVDDRRLRAVLSVAEGLTRFHEPAKP